MYLVEWVERVLKAASQTTPSGVATLALLFGILVLLAYLLK